MGFTYTAEQQQVIDVHGRNILVSAAAGSGKTAVLTERIVKMISNEKEPVDIDRLLVVTFTNAAAAEMRERISRAIALRLEQEPDNEHLQKQATLIHNAQITTIDSFCMFVIRNNFNDIGLDPGFRVADEGELKLLRQEVMEQLLEQKYAEKNEGFLNCVEYFSSGNRDKAIEEHIGKLYHFAESNPWPEEWLEERKKDYQISSVEELDAASFIAVGMVQVKDKVESCVEQLRKGIAVCEQPDGPYMYAAMLEEEAERLEKLLHFSDYHEGYARFGEVAFGRLPAKKDDSVSPLKREFVKEIRNGVKDSMKEIAAGYFPMPPENVVKYMEGSVAAVNELIDLALAFRRALQEKKRENGIIDFGDMEHLALSILVERKETGEYEPTRTALDYREYFKEILIDEYQDSNAVQELLLRAVSGEDAGNGNRFMVGDVKQSIYKFRLARPEIFMEKYESYAANHADRQRIDLHKNFRSRREVLDGVNYLFSKIMGKKIGGVEYDKEAALYPGAAYPEQEAGNEDANRIELLLVKKQERGSAEAADAANKKKGGGIAAGETSENGNAKLEKLTDRQREALAVAKRIKEMVGRFPVTDKESGILRPARYRDIVILLRTNAGWDEDFKRILKEEGIPSHAGSKTGYFSAREVQTLLQLLRVIDNPRQDIPLFGVLKSYFGGFSEEEIAYIRARESDRGKELYFCLREADRQDDEAAEGERTEETEGKLREKVRSFLEFLDDCRDKTVYMPIHELLQELMRKSGYLQYVSALPGGEQRRANVQALLEKANSFEQTSYYGLFHFIRYIEQLEKYDVDYGEANILDENADVVRIMSIHKSKGLEFPICFVCGLSKKFNMQDVSGKLIADVDMGIGVDYVDVSNRLQSKTVRKNIVAEKMRLDNMGEELRVLYVALTRAKEKLIMTGEIDKPEQRLETLAAVSSGQEERLSYGEIADAGCYLDWILSALIDDKDLQVRIIGEEDFTEAEIRQQLSEEGRRQKLERLNPMTDLDNELMTYMSDIFSYQYEHSNLADLYTKTTVSEIKKAGQSEEKDFSFRLYEEEQVVPYIPRFMQKEESLGGAGRGSAFHKVMELLDFQALELSGGQPQNGEQPQRNKQSQEQPGLDRLLADMIRRMTEEGKLRRDYAEAVSRPAVEKFLTSPLAKRMAQADRKGMLYREQPFVLGLPARELNEEFPEDELVLIQGIIDVYFEEDGELVVADYKTDRVKSGRELTEKYKKQLDYYARALQKLTGKRVKEKIIYSFGLHKEIRL